MFDLLVRGGVVVTPAGCERRDVAVEDGLIAAVETLAAEELVSRHPVSPFVGRRLRGPVTRTIVRGSTAYVKGDMVTPPGGRLLRPLPARSTEARS